MCLGDAAGPPTQPDASTWDHTITLALQLEMNSALLAFFTLSRNTRLVLAVLELMQVSIIFVYRKTKTKGSLMRNLIIVTLLILWIRLPNISGTSQLHIELEDLIARFVGKPAAITFAMGYVTNSFIIPTLIGEVCAITIPFFFFLKFGQGNLVLRFFVFILIWF